MTDTQPATAATAEAAMNALYKERAALVAFLAIQHDSVLSYSDPEQPEWPVLTVTTGSGQMTWHIAPDDLHLFDGIPFVEAGDSRTAWDGHDTPEKYRRLALLTSDHRAWCGAEGSPFPADLAMRMLDELGHLDRLTAETLRAKWESPNNTTSTADVIRIAREKIDAARHAAQAGPAEA